jgi:hypothetical protein
MAAGLYNFTIEEGADLAFGVRVKINDLQQDLSEWTFKAQVRTAIDGDLITELDVELREDNATLRIGLDGAVTDSLAAQSAKWDLLAVTGDGRRLRLVEGKVTISGSVSEL